ncbi:Ldh family oxidoreductase [Burkholderia sp. Ac-20379]|uniref:Ldh family oxidoreductase n=1 Tax=Burkholderia sp. Ac-20379 TaxID=2703900 RepID=UPI00197FEB2B|nr:Ldh family oxidoreductase [Burkholderia sp. Ac-20379]MBN3727585.1 Ldh family oxidoreductase [Burkholderia sp. Ac-20379]
MSTIERPEILLRPEAPLTALAGNLLHAAGLDRDKADAVAAMLVLTDMMGRGTHGLAQCGPYLNELRSGAMTGHGEPDTIRDLGATVVWDGRYLPGLWLMQQAMALGFSRIAACGVFTFAMRRSHHIGCLAALAKQATDRGYYVTIASSGPHTRLVAPFGGKEGLFSPNPFAFGVPASAFPVLIDTSASLTTVSMTRRKAAAGELFEHPWLLDSQGRPTRDPGVMERSGDRGSLMLLGGVEAGHKGFGLALMIEALTQGLSGFGRLDAPKQWGASVYLQLIDPAAFAGADAARAQMDFFVDQCHANAPIDPERPVRLPGEQAARNIARSRRDGIALAPQTVAALRDWAARLEVDDSLLD